MEDGRIVLVGNENDVLHCGYAYPLSEGGKRYPSADHYAHSMILTQLGLDEVHILELLATSSVNVPQRARELLMENMPAGHDMASLSQYLVTSRQSYTMLGLRLRAEQDKRFRQTLMETNDALLVVCDRRDKELGVGMEDEEFVGFTRRMRANAERISQWMRDERTRPREIGQNQLGFFLMWLRYEIREKERARWMSTLEVRMPGLNAAEPAEGPAAEGKQTEISTSEFVIALQGVFQPLSNYYAHNFEVRGDQYRSVEHYAYQRLFEALKLSPVEVMKIRTTVKPVDVSKMASKLFKVLGIEPAEGGPKMARLERWRQTAMKHKVTKSDYLQKLLLATGHALLVDVTEGGDAHWCCGSDEFELQHLLTKKYITPQAIVDWMMGRETPPSVLSHLGGNKVGLVLMELRAKLAAQTTHRIPLIAPLTSSMLRATVSNHLICFTPESVLHPFHPVEVRLAPDAKETLPSPIHMVAQAAIRFFSIARENAEWVLEAGATPLECWERLHYLVTELMQPPMEKIQQWYMDERQRAFKLAMQLQFEQHPQLLRVLLETGDALLVYCARFSSTEAELSVGMRERDLRLWLSQVRIGTPQLIDLFLRPMAFRPPYFGGNRLGLLLMEVRREFVLKGITALQLPELLGMPVDATLGSDSPLENYVPHVNSFDVLDEWNYRAVWANAFLLMAKQDSMPADIWLKANSVKTPPAMLSTDEAQISELYSQLASLPPKSSHIADQLAEQYAEVVRAVYSRMKAHMLDRLKEEEEIQKLIGQKSKESNRLLDIRRTAEQLLHREKGGVGGGGGSNVPLPDVQMPKWGPVGHNRGRERSPLPGPPMPFIPAGSQQMQTSSGGKIPSLLADMSPPPPPQPMSMTGMSPSIRTGFTGVTRHHGNDQGGRRPPPASTTRYHHRPQRNYGSGGRTPSPPPQRGGVRRPASPSARMTRPSSPIARPTAVTPPPANNEAKPPATKKPKRQIDESELSEGEILSDEDED